MLIGFAVSFQNQFWSNLTFNQGVWTVIKVALILAIFELLIKPIVKLLLIPINLLTLGTFRIVINTLGFYLAAFLLGDFIINTIDIAPFTLQGFSIPRLHFTGFWAHLVNAVSTNFLVYLFKTIIKPKKEKK